MNNYVGIESRIVVDIDNERPYDSSILGLSQRDEVLSFAGDTIVLTEGMYVYMITENFDEDIPDHILSEGLVIKKPYPDLPYKWCCRIEGKIEYLEDYNRRFNID